MFEKKVKNLILYVPHKLLVICKCTALHKLCIWVNIFPCSSNPRPFCSKILKRLQKSEIIHQKWPFDDFSTYLHFFKFCYNKVKGN